jgi:hypothetical protein
MTDEQKPETKLRRSCQGEPHHVLPIKVSVKWTSFILGVLDEGLSTSMTTNASADLRLSYQANQRDKDGMAME